MAVLALPSKGLELASSLKESLRCRQPQEKARMIPLRRSLSSVASVAVVAAVTAAAATAAQAQSADEFFRGKKELYLNTSSSVGGGYDSYSRLVARHMTKYLPGNPTIVVQNMVGGGGIRAANYIYNVAPKDGSVYCLIDRGMPTAPLLYGDRSQARFDAEKFSWIVSIMR